MSQDEHATLEANKAVVRRWFEEVLSQGHIEVMDMICTACAPQTVLMQGVIPNAPGGMDGARQMIRDFRAAFSDLHFTPEEQVAEGDKVLTVLTVEGTNDGPFLGMPSTGNRMRISGMSLWRVVDGHLVGETVSWDMLGAFQQLGLMPGGAGDA
jgi:predicted ester cyclase